MSLEPRPEPVPADGTEFDNRFTSAAADLSAGGVATAGQTTQPPAVEAATPTPAAVEALEELDEPIRPAPQVEPERTSERTSGRTSATDFSEDRGPMPVSRGVGVGAGAAVALAGSASGAWLLLRWRRHRNKPINRLRRHVRALSREIDSQVRSGELAVPAGGAASLAVVTSALLARAFMAGRGSTGDSPVAAPTLEQVRSRWQRLPGAATSRSLANGGAALLGAARDRVGSAPKPATPVSIGFGSLVVLAGAGYFVWRLLTRDQDATQTWQEQTAAGE